jgi:hypothetical protein
MKQETTNNFFNTLKHFDDMPEVEFPSALHGRIMRSLYLQQFKLPLVLINAILFVNLSISSFHLWHMSKDGFREAFRIISQGGPSFASAGHAMTALPLETSGVFLANLALMTAGMYLLYRLRMLMTMARNSSR